MKSLCNCVLHEIMMERFPPINCMATIHTLTFRQWRMVVLMQLRCWLTKERTRTYRVPQVIICKSNLVFQVNICKSNPFFQVNICKSNPVFQVNIWKSNPVFQVNIYKSNLVFQVNICKSNPVFQVNIWKSNPFSFQILQNRWDLRVQIKLG